jgi:hypothetical protein
MRRYFFHLEDGNIETDQEGTELEGDRQSLVAEAISLMAHTLRDRPEKLTDEDDVQIRVADEQGMTLLTIHTTLSYSPALSKGTLW